MGGPSANLPWETLAASRTSTISTAMSKPFGILLFLSFCSTLASAALRVPNIFGDHMVIQRDQPIRVWGWAEPGANVQVRFGDRDLTVKAGGDARWSLELEALPVSTQAKSLHISSSSESITYDGILVGDVWLLGGQSNMEDVLEDIYHGDTEVASAHYPNIRLMTVPQQARNTPLEDIDRINEFNAWTNRFEEKGSWFHCTPKAVRRFSAIGYIFGRRLHQVSGVPVGLIDASWGGTTAEAWTSLATLGSFEAATPLLDEWQAKVEAYDAEASLQQRIARWERDTERRKKEGKEPNEKPTEPEQDPRTDRNHPGGSFNGMIAPYAGFSIKGAIFNQGYNNALGDARPKLYARVFQSMIEDWRKAFRNEAMPFGIVALTAGGEPQSDDNFEQRMVDAAPFIREAQAKAWQALEHVGFAPAYDQQVPWYHPHKKFELGERMARWALFNYYGQDQLGWQPARCTKSEIQGDCIILSFDRNVRVHDGRPFEGFAIAGKDRHFYPAKAEFLIVGKDQNNRDKRDESTLVVSHLLVRTPVAVRYAWARNPKGNAVNSRHHERTIPIVSFRTDTWDWPEAPFAKDQSEHRRKINELRKQAREWTNERQIAEAKAFLESAAARAN